MEQSAVLGFVERWNYLRCFHTGLDFHTEQHVNFLFDPMQPIVTDQDLLASPQGFTNSYE